MKKNQEVNDIIREKDLEFSLDLPNSVPIAQSPLAESPRTENMIVFVEALKVVYRKYIDINSASLPVNISGPVRRELTELVETNCSAGGGESAFYDDLEFIGETLFWLDKAALEVSKLMNDSFYRFRKTEVFVKVVSVDSL